MKRMAVGIRQAGQREPRETNRTCGARHTRRHPHDAIAFDVDELSAQIGELAWSGLRGLSPSDNARRTA